MDIIKAIMALAAVAVAGTSAHAQNLIVVNSDGSGDFIKIQDAVDFAADGDVIRVINSGESYSSFNLDNRSLILVGDGHPEIRNSSYIHNLDPPGSAAIDGFIFERPLIVFDNRGPVWVEDIEVGPIYSIFFLTPLEISALRVIRNEEVSLTRVVAQGAPAIEITGSDVFIYDSSISGIEGQAGFSICIPGPILCGYCDTADGEKGHPGIDVSSGSSLYLSNSIVRGGPGGLTGNSITSSCPKCTNGGPGGDALRIGTGTRVEYLDSQFIPGNGGGTVPDCTLFTGEPGSAIVHTSNGVDVGLPGTSVSFEASSLNKAGDPVSLKLTGEPFGHLIYLQIATSQNPVYLPPLEGAWLIEQTAPYFFIGSIPASGTLELAPALNPLGIPVLPLYAQAIFVDFPGGIATRQFSSPSLMIAYE